MSDNFIHLYYHIVRTTKGRVPYVTDEIEAPLFQHMETICRSMGVTLHAVNGMPDHVHMVCSIPPGIAVSDVIKNVKGKSAHYVNHLDGDRLYVAWQPKYGALTLAKRNLKTVVNCVRNQKHHHATSTLSAAMEQATDVASDVPEGHSGTQWPRTSVRGIRLLFLTAQPLCNFMPASVSNSA